MNDNGYKRCKNLINPWKNPDLLEFVRQKYPGMDIHHLLGSLGSLKISDSLIIPLKRDRHNYADKHREETFTDYLPFAVNILQEYISHLETQLTHTQNKED